MYVKYSRWGLCDLLRKIRLPRILGVGVADADIEPVGQKNDQENNDDASNELHGLPPCDFGVRVQRSFSHAHPGYSG